MSDKTIDKTSDALLICPFCGGEAELDSDSRFDNWFIRCNKCLCKTRTFKTERSAILTWDNRKPMERILERLEEEAKKAMSNSEKAAELGQKYEKHMIFNGAKGNAFEEAIEIVKEEGGLNE